MNIKVAEHAGFCFGVKDAVNRAFEVINGRKDTQIYSLNALVHNDHVVGKMKDSGVKIVSSLDEITEKGILLISAHGVSPKIIEQATQKGLEIINTTCPFVTKVQQQAERFHEAEKQVIIIGDKKHPEVTGIKELAGDNPLVITSPAEVVEELSLENSFGIVAQTTQSAKNVKDICQKLTETFPKANFVQTDTICNATYNNQSTSVKLADEVDVMIIIGDKKSANSNRLYELCKQRNDKTYFIQNKSSVEKEWFGGVECVGIGAGASTPSWVIDEVIEAVNG